MERKKPTGERSEERDLPGYPHYPPEDDILNPRNGFHKVGGDPENLPNSSRLARTSLEGPQQLPGDNDAFDTGEEDDELAIVRGTEADVTREDLALLGDRDGDADGGDDEITRRVRVDQVDNEEDLDIPGSDLDDRQEEIGEEDEENNYYSLGGERHENLEEDPS